MRHSYDRSSRSKNTSSWIFGGVAAAILVLVIFGRIFSGSSEKTDGSYLLVTPMPESTVYISMSSSSKSRISESEKLYATDKSVSVQVGGARADNDDLSIDLDKTTELTYKENSGSGNVLTIQKGRAWIKTLKGSTQIGLKFMDISSSPDTIVMVEQNNLSSTAYMIQGSVLITTKIGVYTLTAGNRIMIAGSDLSNTSTKLETLAGPIDDTIGEQPLFIRNNGSDLLKNVSNISSTGGASSGSLIEENTGSLMSQTNSKFIEITDPIDGTLVKNSTFAVMGNILSPEVKRVTINEVSATVSPVNQTFVLQNIPLSSETVNLVYKAYGDNDRLLERSVITVFGSKTAVNEGGSRLVPDNFPVSNKDFPITFPTDNPYKTTDSLVRVEGTVPKDRIGYIMVNDYRLQKFSAGGTKWYYFANTATETMKEGINLYNIKFYGTDNSLIYTQVFTIVKEQKNATVSGEGIQ